MQVADTAGNVLGSDGGELGQRWVTHLAMQVVLQARSEGSFDDPDMILLLAVLGAVKELRHGSDEGPM